MPDSNPLWIDAGQDESLGNATISSSTDELTLAGHDLSNGQLVTFTNTSGGGTVLAVGGVYYVVNVDTNTFQVSTFLGGPPVDFSTNGSADVFRYRPAYDARSVRRAMSGLMQIGRTSGVDPVHSHPFGAREGIFAPPDGAVVGISGGDWTTTDLVAVVYPGLSSQAGPYLVAHPAETGALDAPDGSQDRIDALDLQVQDDFEDSSGERRARIVYVAGTPGSGTRGSITPNSLEIGRITVHSGGSPGPDPVTTAPLTVARGGVIPVADSNEYPSGNRYAGMVLWDRETNALVVDTTGNGDWLAVASEQGFRLGERLEFDGTNGPGAGSGGSDQTYNFNPDDYPGARAAFVRVQAAGGAGGGALATGSNEASAGAGGQGGGYAEAWLTWDEIESEASGGTITITAPGRASGNGGATGDDGGSASFGTLVTAQGGEGGAGTAADTSKASLSGATSTQALNGDLEIGGGGGGMCLRDGINPLGSFGGAGGDSVLGTGGRGAGQNVGGDAGKGRGGGGGGSANDSNASEKSGGNGQRGIVLVDIYY